MLKIIKRNKFTILLGLILSIIFATIIILSQRKESNFILTPAKRNENFQVEINQNTNSTNEVTQDLDQSEETLDTTPNNTSGAESIGTIDYVKPAENVDEIISNLDPVSISFTSKNGFEPRDITGVQGQRLLWTNRTNRIIKIIQVNTKYTNLPETIEIGPGQTYGLTLTESGDWEFREVESGITGSIFVYKKKSTQN